MARLTNVMRDEIIDAFYGEVIAPRREAFEKKLTAACQKAADALHPPAVKKWLDDMPSAAKDMIATMGNVNPLIDEKTYLEDVFNRGSTWRNRFTVSLPNPIYEPAGMRHNRGVIIPKAAAMQKELQIIFNDWKHLKSTLLQALHSCTTDKQLREKYPDIAAKLPPVEKQTKAMTITPDAVAKAIKCAAKGGCK